MAETLKERASYAKTMAMVRAAEREAAAPAQEDRLCVVGLEREQLAVGQAVLRLLVAGAGWLRLVPDADGIVWCKWRYSSGRWEGCYSLVVWKPKESTLSAALEALERKVTGALAAVPTHKPSPDRY